MGSLATAWALTHGADPERFEITVYQKDWLLGGKGASTRDSLNGQRIHEHGLHLLLGFYNSALSLLRVAYKEVHAADPATLLPEFNDVLLPWDHIWMAEQHPAGVWQKQPWLAHFPANGQAPGFRTSRPGLAALVRQSLSEFVQRCKALAADMGISHADIFLDQLPRGIDKFIAIVHGVEHALALAGEVVGNFLEAAAEEPVLMLIDKAVGAIWRLAQPRMDEPAVRRAWIVVYLLAANITGVLRDDVLSRGIAHLNDIDYRDWLKKHGPKDIPAYLGHESAPILALYDLAFSRRTGLATGVTLHAVLRMVFDYAGHFSYKMKGGMGEIVFAPIYLALKQRGVRFRFMHEVTKLHVEADGATPVVSAIDFRLPIDAAQYNDPLAPVTGKDGSVRLAWPFHAPPISKGPTTSLTLRRGQEGADGFDVVVLGISMGGLTPALVGELENASPRFKQATSTATTVGTQAVQLWLTKGSRELGWEEQPEEGMLISYERPFNAWVDMSHLIPIENWPEGGPVSVHYLCDEFHETDHPDDPDIQKSAAAWLATKANGIWPNFSMAMLHDPDAAHSGMQRLQAQYFRKNNEGSERYVTVGPKSPQHRLEPGDTGFRNLAVAGDWVRTELSSGCLESATEGGLLAGKAIQEGRVKP